MKNIKSIKHLRAEKKKLKERQEQLEGTIRQNWDGIKEGLRPVNMVKDTISSVFEKKTEDNLKGGGFFKTAVLFGVSLLAKKVLSKKKKAASETSCS